MNGHKSGHCTMHVNKMVILLQKESNFILLLSVFMTGLYAECEINIDIIIDRLDAGDC